MKCFNCLSRFVSKPKINKEDNCEDQSMATWDDFEMYGFSIRDSGLKTCPFDPNHKMKASKYSQHIMKCEQRFPKSNQRTESTLSLNAARIANVTAFFESLSDNSSVNCLTKSMNQLNVSDDWSSPESPQIPMPSTSGASDESLSSDSAIGLTNNVNSFEENIENHVSAQTSSLTSSPQNTINSDETEERTEPTTDTRCVQPIVPIIRQQVTAIPEPTNEPNNEDNGSGDSDNEWKSGSNFNLYEGFDNLDDLTEDQMMEMADSFIDVVLLAKMTKPQRKKLNEKLIQLRKSEKVLKNKAFNELVELKDAFDPQLKDIPQEIRKPRLDIREMFNLNKKQNQIIETLMSATPLSPEVNHFPPNPNEAEKQTPESTSEESAEKTTNCCSESSPERLGDCHEITTLCNNCFDPLAINMETIRRLNVFCAKCCGVKFGGYFECHSCKMYGYFANNQIAQHLAKHFPRTD